MPSVDQSTPAEHSPTSAERRAEALERVDMEFKQNVMVRAHEASGLRPEEFVHTLYEVMGAEPFVAAGEESATLHEWKQGQRELADDVTTAAAVVLSRQQGHRQDWRSQPDRGRAGVSDRPTGAASIEEQCEALDRVDRDFKRSTIARAREVSGLKRQPFARRLHEMAQDGPAHAQEWRRVGQWERGWMLGPSDPSNEIVAAAGSLIPDRRDGYGHDWGTPATPGVVDLDAMQDRTRGRTVPCVPMARGFSRPVPGLGGMERPGGWELDR